MRQPSNRGYFLTTVPTLPVEECLQQISKDYTAVLEAYDRHLEGQLDFEYCDQVADIYERVFSTTTNPELKRLTLTRLLAIGTRHNRYYVRKTIVRLLSDHNGTSNAGLAAQVLNADREGARWVAAHPNLDRQRLPAEIVTALNAP